MMLRFEFRLTYQGLLGYCAHSWRSGSGCLRHWRSCLTSRESDELTRSCSLICHRRQTLVETATGCWPSWNPGLYCLSFVRSGTGLEHHVSNRAPITRRQRCSWELSPCAFFVHMRYFLNLIFHHQLYDQLCFEKARYHFDGSFTLIEHCFAHSAYPLSFMRFKFSCWW